MLPTVFSMSIGGGLEDRPCSRANCSTSSNVGPAGAAVPAGSRSNTATMAFAARDAGVVMPRRSGLGTARVCLDPGTAAASCTRLDLGSASNRGARRIVFARDLADPASRHMVRVAVVRGRVDLDAFVTLR